MSRFTAFFAGYLPYAYIAISLLYMYVGQNDWSMISMCVFSIIGWVAYLDMQRQAGRLAGVLHMVYTILDETAGENK